MSKLKAAEKAKKRKAKLAKNKLKKQQQLMLEKSSFIEVQRRNIIRNNLDNVTRVKDAERKESQNSQPAQYAKNRIQAVVASLVNVIGENHQLAYDFILEEINAASLGNESAREFVNQSGFKSSEYKGALNRSISAVETGPQMILIEFASAVMAEKGIDFAVRLRLEVVDRIMQIYMLGKYKSSDMMIDLDGKAREAFEEYFVYCKKPKLYGTVELIRKLLALAAKVAEPSETLKTHLNLMKIVSLCDLKMKSVRLPEALINKGLITDLKIVSITSRDSWISAAKGLLNSGIKQQDLVAALDIPRQIGDFEGKCVVNVAPAIYNTFNLLYAELPNCSYLESIEHIMHDSSLVEGAVMGGGNLHFEYQHWVFSQVGLNS